VKGTRSGWATLLLGSFVVATSAGAGGCKHHSAVVAGDAGRSTPVVRADTEGLLLTWIDDKGDFHVETRVADVPLMGRDAVRVESENGDYGLDAELVFVVDLRQAGVDGAYPLRTMTRAQFEALAVARREKTGPTLASAAPLPPTVSAEVPAAGVPGKATSRAVVVIYGAEWCGACHDAARYLRHKGIAYVEKDVEKDPAASQEMRELLAKNGLRGGSIPVIDVRGKIMVGFSPPDIDAALGETL
jgi:glutaredoxin